MPPVLLMVAARGDGLDTVTRLLNAHADVNAVNEKAERGSTAIHIASAQSTGPMIRQLAAVRA